jgi:hypothetical protein
LLQILGAVHRIADDIHQAVGLEIALTDCTACQIGGSSKLKNPEFAENGR